MQKLFLAVEPDSDVSLEIFDLSGDAPYIVEVEASDLVLTPLGSTAMAGPSYKRLPNPMSEGTPVYKAPMLAHLNVSDELLAQMANDPAGKDDAYYLLARDRRFAVHVRDYSHTRLIKDGDDIVRVCLAGSTADVIINLENQAKDGELLVIELVASVEDLELKAVDWTEEVAPPDAIQ